MLQFWKFWIFFYFLFANGGGFVLVVAIVMIKVDSCLETGNADIQKKREKLEGVRKDQNAVFVVHDNICVLIFDVEICF
ncbi:hypothetical protein MtrunA17_Chr3g0102201 [Medicago truncatula]|uniref:Transmembrane protein n=1 Tax=Medicago truncatula TaxID=3880 RepID=A0A396IWR7_MEDTR|nr:hypothetical protein MtrunA17_Chr3g0102201 [Medicago truncatula]